MQGEKVTALNSPPNLRFNTMCFFVIIATIYVIVGEKKREEEEE